MSLSFHSSAGTLARPVARAPRPAHAGGRLKVVSVATTEAQQRGAKQTFANQLEALKSMSTVVADTGEIESIRAFKPVDCTTNPSLVLKAVQNPVYEHYLGKAIKDAADTFGGPMKDPSRPHSLIADALAVNIGMELLGIVPGRVSTEVDAHLSYNTQATIDKALSIVDLYSKKNVDLKRIYIKIASTWEGIRACEVLQKQGIDTNMTLLFSFAQGAACADAGATLISPFVGRIMDWYKKKEGHEFTPQEDPGVKSVRRIYEYYKKYGYKTIVMAASFRNVGEIQELAGCDNITISPALLGQLESITEPLERKLYPELGQSCQEPREEILAASEPRFRELHEADHMATDKLSDGVESFASDQRKLEELIAAKLR